MFNDAQWLESKTKQFICDDAIVYAKVACARVVKFAKISAYSTKPSSKVLIKLGVIGMFFIDKTG